MPPRIYRVKKGSGQSNSLLSSFLQLIMSEQFAGVAKSLSQAKTNGPPAQASAGTHATAVVSLLLVLSVHCMVIFGVEVRMICTSPSSSVSTVTESRSLLA
jgi:hypothetical protein